MFEKVFLALEMDPAAHEIVSCMCGLKPLGAKEVYVAHCLSVSEAIAASLELAVDRLKEGLAGLQEDLQQQGFKVGGQVAVASSHTVINQLIRAQGAKLVVVGAPAATAGGDLLYGGVASTILHHPLTPVLIYRLRGEESPCQGKACDFFNHILFATDFSANADQAFGILEKLAGLTGRITLAHIQDMVRIDPHLQHKLPEFMRIDQERLDSLRQRLAARSKTQVKTTIRAGIPAAELLRLERELQPSLVVMGSQGRGYFEEVFLGSISSAMARKGISHLLLIPSSAKDKS